MDPSSLLGPIDLIAPVIEYLIFGLVIVNMGTRFFQHKRHKAAVASGAASLSREPIHVASNLALVLATFYFLSLEYHSGVVLATLVVGLFITDFFEFESRQVEVRNDMELEPPKAAIAASGLVFLYAFYLSLFFIIAPVWRAIV